jgi:N-acetyl-gamma-glutamyl-phosphate reductase / acetylglutamate kinase
VNYIKRPVWPTVFGVSGYSGAGTVTGTNDPDGRPTTVAKVSPESLGGGIRPYALTDHIHEREAGRHLSHLLADPSDPLKVAFIPSVAPWFSGILATLSMPLSAKVSAKDVKALFEEKYAGERLVTIKRDVPSLQDVEGKHGWTVGGFQVHSEGDRAVVVVRLSRP